MKPRTSKLAFLLLGTGACSLIYQMVWLRELKLVFGASTAATAAVLAIFMGGLGVGSIVLGRKADQVARPLRFYAVLEASTAVSAALSPALIWLTGTLYVAIGGSETLGTNGATALRLVLSAIVLGLPTFLMGGSLPAVARVVTTEDDERRSRLAVLYGVNTLGAVMGVLLATFLLLEVLGARQSLFVACLVNLLIAVIANSMDRRSAQGNGGSSRSDPGEAAGAQAPSPEAGSEHPIPARLVVCAAAVVGFAFFYMEIVWYRMLSPLLGGSVFTFGLILAVALLGIGLGGAAYAVVGRGRQATLLGFSTTCLLEATAVALPLALGDRIALLAMQLRPLGAFGFGGLVASWAMVTALVVFPAAFIAGIQLPLLINLLGRGARSVGRHVGLIYAFNTAGSVAGSLAAGFGLLSLLGALPSWRLVGGVLLALGIVCALGSAARERARFELTLPALTALIVVLMLLAQGPTVAWRHSSIGAGRASVLSDEADKERFLRSWRGSIVWEEDGVESAVASFGRNGLDLFVNGKSDGNSIVDAPTMVMTGLVGALLHPKPRQAAVIGLGTGASSGWLAEVGTIDRVDTIELEPAVLRFAESARDVNHDVVNHPKSRILIGDAREKLLVSSERYDLIASQPSNPFRAGIASLLTREFYHAVERRLADNGLFLQWVQAYEVDSGTIEIMYATLAAVFPHVETWQTMPGDLLFVCSRHPVTYDVQRLRARADEEPFRSALSLLWGVGGLEGFLSRFVASYELADLIAAKAVEINTDDRLPIEFAFARTVGTSSGFSIDQIREMAHRKGMVRPKDVRGDIDWGLVEELRLSLYSTRGQPPPPELRERLLRDNKGLVQAHTLFVGGRWRDIPAAWNESGRPPRGLHESRIAAIGAVYAATEDANERILAIEPLQPVEALFLRAQLAMRTGEDDIAVELLEESFARAASDPWVNRIVLGNGLIDAEILGRKDPRYARRLFQALKTPFASLNREHRRKESMVKLGMILAQDDPSACVEALAVFEPWPPWSLGHLVRRRSCYEENDHPLLPVARADLRRYVGSTGVPFDPSVMLGPHRNSHEPGDDPALPMVIEEVDAGSVSTEPFAD